MSVQFDQYFCFLCMLLLWSCEEATTSAPPPESVNAERNKLLILEGQKKALLFKAEQKLEIWNEADSTRQLIASYDVKLPPKLPIGIFEVDSQRQHQIFLNNNHPFYQRKKISLDHQSLFFSSISPIEISLQQVMILPNDMRLEGHFRPCFACPHWMAELYAQLEIQLLHYPIDTLQ